jgi:regulator of RNase E activity RraA
MATIDFKRMRETMYSGVIADILDELGCRNQVMRHDIRPLKPDDVIAGRAYTVLAADVYEIPAEPYKLEFESVDSLSPDDVLVATTNGSTCSGFWGELLSTVSLCRGATGAVIDGMSRDSRKIRDMDFTLFCRGFNPLDSKGRTDVIAHNVVIECGGVAVHPGDLVFGDCDGLVVIPAKAAEEVLRKAYEKANAENVVRDAILAGASAREVWDKYHIL